LLWRKQTFWDVCTLGCLLVGFCVVEKSALNWWGFKRELKRGFKYSRTSI
jgi:hypothetical protein